MSKTRPAISCPHVGIEHPMYFQCGNCDDTADQCNCSFCGFVFCEKCQKMIFIDCEDVVDAWVDNHPDLDMDLERLKIEGVIKSYQVQSPNHSTTKET